MKISKLKILGLFLLLGQMAWAQSSLSGVIKNSNGQVLPNAVVQLLGSKTAVGAGLDGFFSLDNLTNGQYDVQVSYVGYESSVTKVTLQNERKTLHIVLNEKENLQDEVVVIGTRATVKDPIAFTTVKSTDLKMLSPTNDIPYLLAMTPSVVTSSDAGNGVGYTSIKVRGTDANRINVTVDGIPMNDAESHGVWWVNMPDIASSTSSFQVQRGVGTSSQGAGAFGASINMQTESLNKDAYSTVTGSYGSFKTSKLTAKVGTGLLEDHFTFDARLSKVGSDGYIDRATSNLKSFYLSGGYYANNTTVKVDVFSGAEKTYQAWWGVPTVRLENDEAGMKRYYEHGLYSHTQYKQMVNSDSRTYNYYTYDNQTDNYAQDHYHITLNQILTDNITLKAGGHYTYGRGYYENYLDSAKLSKYGLSDAIIGTDTISQMNSVNQKWLNNDFYGAVFSLNYNSEELAVTFGGGVNQYDGRHYGKIIWAGYPSPVAKDYEWYRSTGNKLDGNIYVRANYAVSDVVNVFADLQYRHIEHDIDGVDDKGRDITQLHEYDFFNPKVGVSINATDNIRTFASFSVANREPNRSNFVDAIPAYGTPRSERLYDWEVGADYHNKALSAGVNGYFMNYNDQLVLTGAINDVGTALMMNVDKSYRLGVEVQAAYTTKFIDVMATATLSKNKIKDFDEFIENWDAGKVDTISHTNVDIAFSPNFLASGVITIKPMKDLKVNFISQYVHRQFLDNTQSYDRYIAPYFIENVSVNYHFEPSFCKGIDVGVFVNNVLDREYITNGWVYSYKYENKRNSMDGLFTQAGANIIGTLTFSF